MVCSDPITTRDIYLFGGESFEGVTFSKTQIKQFQKLYPSAEKEVLSNPLNDAIDLRDLFRYVKRDGLRVMGILAKFCEAGEDPVKILVQILIEQGFDVGDLLAWIDEDEDAKI